jgi:hypothetical protein
MWEQYKWVMMNHEHRETHTIFVIYLKCELKSFILIERIEIE